MTQTSFDDFNQPTLGENLQPPLQFFLRKKENKGVDKYLEWLKKEIDVRMKDAEPRMRYYRRNMALYKGVHYKNYDSRTDNRSEDGSESIRKPKIVVNFIQETVDLRVARMARVKPNLAVMPQNDDWKNQKHATGIRELVHNRYRQVDMDEIESESDLVANKLGESYVFVEWNAEAGPEHPAYIKAVQKAEARGMDTSKIKLPDGRVLSEAVRVGDVDYRVLGPDRVFPQLRKKKWREVDDLMVVDWMHIEEAKARYPHVADRITLTDDFLKLDEETLELKKSSEEVLVVTYYHKKTKWLPGGKKTVFTIDAICEDGDLPYRHGELPCSRLTDIDLYGELFARSFIQNIVQLQKHFNNNASGIARNHSLGSAPKWMMPKGACSVQALNNEMTVVEFKGPIAPQIAKFNPTPPEVFNYQDKIETYIEKQSKISSTFRGEPPRGITASVALQFFDEQDKERSSMSIMKRYAHLRRIFKLSAQTMAQYYDESDGRTVRILGQDNSYIIKDMSGVDFNVMYDVVIQNISSLPDSKAGRIQTIIDLNNSVNTSDEGPIFSRGEVVQMLDLGLDEKFKDDATVSEKAAQVVLDGILEGVEVPEPNQYDDLFTHRKIFLRELRSRTYKDSIPGEVKAKLVERIKVIEGLMYIMGTNSPAYAQKLAAIPDFPIFFNAPPAVMPPQDPAQATQGGNIKDMNIEAMAGTPVNENKE